MPTLTEGWLQLLIAPGRKRAYGLYQLEGRKPPEFWTYDLEQRRLVDRHPFTGIRLSLSLSSGGDLLYVVTGANKIDVYEAGTFRKLRTLELPEDGSIIAVVPPDTSRSR